MSRYDNLFSKKVQRGRGISDIGKVYRAPRMHLQRGRGFSDVFSGILKFITPYLISGSKAVGKEVLRSGAEILSNVGSQPFGSLLKQHGKQSLKNLTTKAGDKLKRVGDEIMTGGRVKRRRKQKAIKGIKIPKNALINVLSKLSNRSYKVPKINQLGGRRRKKPQVKTQKKKATLTKKKSGGSGGVGSGRGRRKVAAVGNKAALIARFITKTASQKKR